MSDTTDKMRQLLESKDADIQHTIRKTKDVLVTIDLRIGAAQSLLATVEGYVDALIMDFHDAKNANKTAAAKRLLISTENLKAHVEDMRSRTGELYKIKRDLEKLNR